MHGTGSNRKVAIPMDATLKAYVDFSGFSAKNVNRQGDKIEIILPDPKVMTWNRKALLNTASSGWFSSDRTIREYRDEIWHA